MLEIHPNVVLKNTLLTHTVYSSLVQQITDKVKATIPNIERLRTPAGINKDLELLIANLLESLTPRNITIDKKEAVVEILSNLFQLVDGAEKDSVRVDIQFFYDNKQIRKVGYWASKWASVKKFFSELF